MTGAPQVPEGGDPSAADVPEGREARDIDVLSAVVEGDFRVAFELPEDQRLRLADGGAGVLVAAYERKVCESGEALGRVVAMQAAHVQHMRATLLDYLAELDGEGDTVVADDHDNDADGEVSTAGPQGRGDE